MRTERAHLPNRHRGESGAAAVEFGLILLPLMTLLLGMLQYGWYFYSAESTSAAAREAARRVVVGDCWDPVLQFQPFVEAQAPMATAATYTPADLSSDTVPLGSTVTVTVQANGKIIGFLPLPDDGVIVRTFEARLEDKTPTSC